MDANGLHNENDTLLFDYKNPLRKFGGWSVIIGGVMTTGILGTAFLFYIIYDSWRAESWIVKIVESHFAAVVGLPMAGIASLCVVLILESSSRDPIEFEALGFKFRGASGPIVLWIFTFLAIAAAIKILW